MSVRLINSQASTLTLAVTTARPNNYLVSTFETAGGNQAIGQRCVDYLQRVISGNESAYDSTHPPSIAISLVGNAVQANATLTCVSVIATNTVVINGVTFTAVDSGATGNQFVRSGTDSVTATNLAAAINASVTALVSGYVTAAASSNVVTVSSTNFGIYGNQVTLTTGGGTIVASTARLIAGAADATAQTLNF